MRGHPTTVAPHFCSNMHTVLHSFLIVCAINYALALTQAGRDTAHIAGPRALQSRIARRGLTVNSNEERTRAHSHSASVRQHITVIQAPRTPTQRAHRRKIWPAPDDWCKRRPPHPRGTTVHYKCDHSRPEFCLRYRHRIFRHMGHLIRLPMPGPVVPQPDL